MTLLKKWGLLTVLVGIFLMPLMPVHAGMVSTDEVFRQQDRAQLADMLEREDVQKQLIEMGVDPVAAKARVQHLTDEEVAQLNGKIAELPAGAGVSTTHLLLIIIILILLI